MPRRSVRAEMPRRSLRSGSPCFRRRPLSSCGSRSSLTVLLPHWSLYYMYEEKNIRKSLLLPGTSWQVAIALRDPIAVHQLLSCVSSPCEKGPPSHFVQGTSWHVALALGVPSTVHQSPSCTSSHCGKGPSERLLPGTFGPRMTMPLHFKLIYLFTTTCCPHSGHSGRESGMERDV